MDTRAFQLELKDADEGTGEFSGTVTVYGVEDLGADVIERGALSETLKARPEVPLLWSHDPREVIGKGRLQDEGDKVTIKGKLDMKDPVAAKVLHKLKAGLISGLSIGFQAIKVTWEETKERYIRHINELKLWEVSVVTFPMLPAAQVTSVKAAELTTVREFEHFLRNVGFSKARAEAIASKGFAAGVSMPAADPDAELLAFLRSSAG